ncbi:hypothetical protein HON22_03040 [Candidatus Peregrinibacteria bacterium]|jgi:hypothetical protein|nr:hypothetical protein [Candidatus Peregrinibacteria bacterium]
MEKSHNLEAQRDKGMREGMSIRFLFGSPKVENVSDVLKVSRDKLTKSSNENRDEEISKNTSAYKNRVFKIFR